MKKFKKIYVEITNVCNLKCDFCPRSTRKAAFMSLEDFSLILEKIKDYTDYIYLHVMGEPFLHPDINRFIRLANEYKINVNITTNGFLLEKLENNLKIRQLNISLHSFQSMYGVTLDNYLNTIFCKAFELAKEGTYVNYRLWVKNDTTKEILNRLMEKYHVVITDTDKTKTLSKNIFFSREEEFVWPINRLEEGSNYSTLTCRALKDHIAILVDGTIVPCCLDNDASIKLGNIFTDSLDTIMHNSFYVSLLQGFNENHKIHSLCQKCDFYSHKL